MKLFTEKCHTHLIKWTQTTQKLLFFIKCFEEKKIEKKFAHEKRKKN